MPRPGAAASGCRFETTSARIVAASIAGRAAPAGFAMIIAVTAPGLPSPDAARPVGVFDSGVGGLTVLHELLVRLPHEDYVYVGDTAHFPYGERDAEQIARFA